MEGEVYFFASYSFPNVKFKKLLTEWAGNGVRVKSLDSSLYRWYNNLGQVRGAREAKI
jgi:hypothetical protein